MTVNPSDEGGGPKAQGKDVGGKVAVTPGRQTGAEPASSDARPPEDVKEIGGPKGPEPTRFGDWEKGGRCSDF